MFSRDFTTLPLDNCTQTIRSRSSTVGTSATGPCLECLVESESRGERPDRIENFGRRIGLKPEMSDLDLSLGREVCHLDEELLAPLVSVRKERSVDHDTQHPTALRLT